MRVLCVLASGFTLGNAQLTNGDAFVQAFDSLENDSSSDRLYCMRDYNNLISDPSTLPCDRCCPFEQSRAPFGQAFPFSSTTQGCCGLNLYNLETQHCCANEVIINIDHVMEPPASAVYEARRVNVEGQTYIEADLRWDVVLDADEYEVKISRGYNSTYEQPESEWEQITGSGYTMHLSSTTFDYLVEYLSYDVSIRAIDCTEKMSDWYTFRMVAISPEGAIERPDTEGLSRK